jgi:hypothetical protein
MKPKHEIISHLRRQRLHADGMTQQDLADRIGVTLCVARPNRSNGSKSNRHIL